MKITYTAPNRSHHYPYAEALHRAGTLHAFVSGFSRLSPRARLASIGSKLKRHDVLQTAFLGSLNFGLPAILSKTLSRLSSRRLDAVSYEFARESDAFIYYRTQGLRTTKRLHKEGASTLCVMEEVNSHVSFAADILTEELKRLGLSSHYQSEPDHDLRLETYEHADKILCPSSFVTRSFLLSGFAPSKLIQVNFGFPPIDVRPSIRGNSPNKPFRILYVGQLNYRKGLHYAVEAFRKLRHPNKQFVIVGGRTYLTGLEKTKIPEGVVFKGILKGQELESQYREASVFILPSLEEGLALVQGEALSFGLPLLITTNTGGGDLIKDNVEGFIVPPGDVDALADRLQEMADDQDVLPRMSSAALVAARALGSWDVATRLLLGELELAVKTPR